MPKKKESNNSWSKWFVSFQTKGLCQENWVSSKLQTPHLYKAGVWFSIWSSSSVHLTKTWISPDTTSNKIPHSCWLKPKSRQLLRTGKAGKLMVIFPSVDIKEVTESALPQKTHYYSQKDNYTWTWTIRDSIPFGSPSHGNHKQTFNPIFKSIWSEKQFRLKK